MSTLALLTRQRMLVACSAMRLTSRCLATTMGSRGVEARREVNSSQRSTYSLRLPSTALHALARHSHKSAHPEATPTPTPAPAPTDNSSKLRHTSSSDLFGEAANMGLFAKFKHMYKQYWYVLIPVHVLTSVGWFGGFYYLSKSGVDVPALLQYVHLSENIIEKVQGSDMGHYAIAYLCYKVATPLRYALTLGCTTVSIKYLVQHGYIKPMPTKSELIKMYEDKKATRASAKADKAEKGEKDESK
ncbi:hypothetical protein KR009_002721 [Drosophila setifemur]|nr:hypothetical protein KR009_002721 [Drosophila setifemur]